MNLYLINHPECFHYKKFCKKNNYFEGWYFKISNGIEVISFIPGINVENRQLLIIYTSYNNEKIIFYKI